MQGRGSQRWGVAWCTQPTQHAWADMLGVFVPDGSATSEGIVLQTHLTAEWVEHAALPRICNCTERNLLESFCATKGLSDGLRCI